MALRLSGVTMTQPELTMALGQDVVRFEPEDAANSHYAQIDLDNDKPVRALLELASGPGQVIKELLATRQIGLAVLDLAFDFPTEGEAMSARLPAHVAAAIALCDIDIELSVYLVDETDDDDD
ncbi:hypothetical protein PSQ90_15520 [Devosia rhodophyticola]|uniref:DUF4279 domain-containing protein n=1 Tax=Devosia rhodophyticola TaxID=3026423 RepID=A0ABY7YX38_9HYPH|nr:hypothetical protein [Devosia rhodophyticola]WDR05653.1 hypothetical protein PSQ90_15520 [Devosia rhodophyticola]